MKAVAIFAISVAASAAAHAAAPTQSRFEVEASVVSPLPPAQAYEAFTQIGRWWSHTWSGDPGNLSLDARPGGCWCEALPGGGGIEHMRVIWAQPGQQIRMQGALGPLQAMGASGLLIATFAPEGQGARVSVTYIVLNADPAMEEPVAGVIQSQLARFGGLDQP